MDNCNDVDESIIYDYETVTFEISICINQLPFFPDRFDIIKIQEYLKS